MRLAAATTAGCSGRNDASERFHRRAAGEGIRVDGIGAQLQVDENRPLVFVRIDHAQGLPGLALRPQQLQAYRSADVTPDGQNPPARLVRRDDDVAMRSRADAHLTPAVGNRAVHGTTG